MSKELNQEVFGILHDLSEDLQALGHRVTATINILDTEEPMSFRVVTEGATFGGESIEVFNYPDGTAETLHVKIGATHGEEGAIIETSSAVLTKHEKHMQISDLFTELGQVPNN